MTAIARLRRQRQRERRATFRDWDVVLLSLFVGLPVLAAFVAYVLGTLPLRIVRRWRGLTVTFTLEWAEQKQVRRVRQLVPAAFYRAFSEEEGR